MWFCLFYKKNVHWYKINKNNENRDHSHLDTYMFNHHHLEVDKNNTSGGLSPFEFIDQ